MTIEELLGHSTADLEKLTDDQLLEILGPYLGNSQPPGLAKVKAILEEAAKPKPRKPRKKKQPKYIATQEELPLATTPDEATTPQLIQ